MLLYFFWIMFVVDLSSIQALIKLINSTLYFDNGLEVEVNLLYTEWEKIKDLIPDSKFKVEAQDSLVQLKNEGWAHLWTRLALVNPFANLKIWLEGYEAGKEDYRFDNQEGFIST